MFVTFPLLSSPSPSKQVGEDAGALGCEGSARVGGVSEPVVGEGFIGSHRPRGAREPREKATPEKWPRPSLNGLPDLGSRRWGGVGVAGPGPRGAGEGPRS